MLSFVIGHAFHYTYTVYNHAMPRGQYANQAPEIR